MKTGTRTTLSRLVAGLWFIGSIANASENPEWTNYASGRPVRRLAADGDFLWAGTDGGLVRIDKRTLEPVFYNESNSGLPDNRIRALAADPSGGLWIGTVEGLCLFRGEAWTVFGEMNSVLPEGMAVQAVTVDGNGIVWAAARNGLARFDGTSWSLIDGPEPAWGLEDGRSIAVDDSGDVWIGLYEQALVRFDGSEWTTYTPFNSDLPDYYIECLCMDRSGNLWAGTGVGAARWDGTHWTTFDTTGSGLPGNEVLSLSADPSGVVWAGTSGGIARFDGSVWTAFDTSGPDSPGNAVWSVLSEASGDLWVGGMESLFRSRGGEWTACGASNSGLPDNGIRALAADPSGGIWIGTFFNGLTRFGPDGDSGSWETFTPADPIRSWINGIAIDRAGVVWASIVNGGLGRFENGSWEIFNTSNSGIPSDWVNSVLPDDSGGVWAGTDNGLVRFDGNAWSAVYPAVPDAAFPKRVLSIAAVDSGRVWVGAGPRVFEFDGAAWSSWSLEIPDCPWCANDVMHILFDPETGLKWVASPFMLFRLDGHRSTAYPSHELTGNHDNDIEALALDGKGSVWMGTRYGLGHLGAEGWTVYTEANSGLSDDWITSLAMDSSGALWIGTQSGGLCVLRENAADAVAPDRPRSAAPEVCVLDGNFPNPFNPETEIRFRLPQSRRVRLEVFAADGRFVATLVQRRCPAGNHSIRWDGTDQNGVPAPSGLYLYRIFLDGTAGAAGRMVLLR